MTINTDYTPWNTTGLDLLEEPYESCSQNLRQIFDYLHERWGMTWLGCHVNRTIRSGSSWSEHAWGAALDVGYDPAQISRDMLNNEILPVLILWSKELGIQGIDDQGRRWRSHRSGDANGGWKIQTTGYGNWIHIVTTRSMHDNDETMQARLDKAFGAVTPDAPVTRPPNPKIPPPSSFLRFDPGEREYGLWPLRRNLPTVKRVTGDVSQFEKDTTRFVQGVILHEAGGSIIVDGLFGRQTDRRVREVQEFFGEAVDGVVGPKTMAVIQYLAAMGEGSEHPAIEELHGDDADAQSKGSFDPGNYNVEIVLEYLSNNPADKQRVIDAEKAGQNRKTIVEA